MRIRHFFAILAICFFSEAVAQVKIGDNPQNIDPASILEIESSSGVLVIPRLTTAQMNNLTPLRGAMIYNLDSECLHYYNGADWINFCQSTGNSFAYTTEAIFNQNPNVADSTIVITQTGDNYNFEVNEITGANIVDGSINGFLDIQFNSIDEDQLAPNSVGQEELQDNTVGDLEIDYGQVTLSDFDNDAGYITGASIISTDTPNSIIVGTDGGAFYDESNLQTAINTVETSLNNHIASDGDLDDQNEIQDAAAVDIEPITGITANNVQTALQEIQTDINNLNSGGSNTDEQDLGIGAGGTPDQSVEVTITNGNNAIINIQDADANPTNEFQNLQFNAGTNILTLTNPATAGNQVDLSSLAGGGGSTEFADQITIVGNGTLGNEFEVADNAITTNKILDNNVTTNKIQEGLVAGQVLTTNAAGDVVWALPSDGGGGTTELADQITIVGDGTAGNEFEVADGGITGIKINDMGAAVGQVLEWNGTTWAPAADDVATGGGADGVINTVVLNGTDLEFTGVGGAFNGTVSLAGLGGGGGNQNLD